MKVVSAFLLAISCFFLFGCTDIQSLQPYELEQIIAQKYMVSRNQIKQIDILVANDTVLNLDKIPFIEDLINLHINNNEPDNLMLYMAYITGDSEKLVFYQRNFKKGTDGGLMVQMVDYFDILPLSLKNIPFTFDKQPQFIKISFGYNDSNSYFTDLVSIHDLNNQYLKYFIIYIIDEIEYCITVINNKFAIININNGNTIFSNL